MEITRVSTFHTLARLNIQVLMSTCEHLDAKENAALQVRRKPRIESSEASTRQVLNTCIQQCKTCTISGKG